jgi:hypothetical protein
VIERLLPEDLLQQHLTRAHGTRRFVDLGHDSSLSANADPIGFLLWWGWRDNARRQIRCREIRNKISSDFRNRKNACESNGVCGGRPCPRSGICLHLTQFNSYDLGLFPLSFEGINR